MRKLSFILILLICIAQEICAQRLIADYKDSHYRLYNSDGTVYTNYIFDHIDVDSANNIAMVKYSYKYYLVDGNGCMLLTHSVPDDIMRIGTLIFDTKGHDATNKIIDCHGNVVSDEWRNVEVWTKHKLSNGKEFFLLKGCHKNDNKEMIYGPDLKPLFEKKFCNLSSCDGLFIVNSDNSVINVLKETIVPGNNKVEIISLSDLRVKKDKSINELYSYEELHKENLILASSSNFFYIYSPYGQLLGSSKLKKGSLTKQAIKHYKDFILPYLKHKQLNHQLFDEKVNAPLLQLSGRNVDVKSNSTGKRPLINEWLSKHSNLKFFPVLADKEWNDTSIPRIVSQKAKNSKYGKLTKVTRTVESDGMVYFEAKYSNGKTAVFNAKGNILVQPTTYSIVYHNHTQSFSTYSGDYPNYKNHQLYSWNGHLLVNCDKKGYDNAHFYIEDDGRCYVKIKKNGKEGALDYFGVQLTPIAYQGLFCSEETFMYGQNGEYVDTKYSLPKTSRPGGKATSPRKFPAYVKVDAPLVAKKESKPEPETTIKILDPEFDVYVNGQKGIKFHYHVVINNHYKDKINFSIFFYTENGNKLYGTYSGYKANDNHVCTYADGKADYQSTEWKDLWLFIPYEAIGSSLETGTYNLSAQLEVRDVKHGYSNLGSSEKQTFQFNHVKTVQEVYQQPQNENSTVTVLSAIADALGQAGNAIGQMSGGGYQQQGYGQQQNYDYNNSINSYSSDQSSSRSHICVYCKGTGVCGSCRGSGQSHMTITGTNVHRKCPDCHGTTVCKYCKGRRYKGGTGPSNPNIGNTRVSGTVNSNCLDCHGNGNCGECNGRAYTLVAGKKTQCWRCKGRGVCATCYGSKLYDFPVRFKEEWNEY